ncbi:DOPA-like domain-containing protein [Pterulicium gracile]|uniref:DOPA-like domain-containing protein n=1 Tax=Pterulicium gracile TaxID=1884261 RepID=A0A5C3QGB2_9AGAR|nr:DOPA-like domain-containing protein [Pterula gracilis]
MSSVSDTSSVPETDLKTVVDGEVKEWHFHIYFHQNNTSEKLAAETLRDAVLRLRKQGAFIAVPLFRVNYGPMGPHPVGSYEIWTPAESFNSVFSYLCMNRGALSVLVHPLTRHESLLSSDHEVRNAWLGAPFPLDLSVLPVESKRTPLQYPTLEVGYSSRAPGFTLKERRKLGAHVENILKDDDQAAKAP